MLAKLSEFSQQQLGQQLGQALGQTLSESELSNCFKHIQVLVELATGKRFWHAADPRVGVYIVLAGKVRLLNSSEKLISSLAAGAFFGELTLFAEEQFQLYTAKASVNLKLCHIPGDWWRSLIHKYISGRDVPLQPGMSISANIKVCNRTVMSIFTDPFT